MLSPEIQSQILALHFGQERSLRSIEKELGVSRKSIRRVIERRSVELSIEVGPRPSILDTLKPLAEEILRKHPYLTSTALLNRLRSEGYMGGKTVVKDWLQKERIPKAPREAFLRIDFSPGECAQVDWGEFGDVFGDDVKIHAFIMVLAYSRLLYVEFTRSERFEDFVRCHESAFRFFGGVPRECWYDNLATAVTERMGKIVRFNARFFAYSGHHNFRPHACNPARGNEKGRVESGVKLIRNSFWSGREFKNLADLQGQATEWMNSSCNEREHRSTRKVPRLLFEAEEKEALLPLNHHPYDTDEILSRVVPPDFHVLFETNRYSVPWTLTGMTVTLRING
jgi:transposase